VSMRSALFCDVCPCAMRWFVMCPCTVCVRVGCPFRSIASQHRKIGSRIKCVNEKVHTNWECTYVDQIDSMEIAARIAKCIHFRPTHRKGDAEWECKMHTAPQQLHIAAFCEKKLAQCTNGNAKCTECPNKLVWQHLFQTAWTSAYCKMYMSHLRIQFSFQIFQVAIERNGQPTRTHTVHGHTSQTSAKRMDTHHKPAHSTWTHITKQRTAHGDTCIVRTFSLLF
jgi:hypothetical protein